MPLPLITLAAAAASFACQGPSHHDGDNLRCANVPGSMRLQGIDAPEMPQTCQLNGRLWGCHGVAFRHLQLLAGRGEVTCTYKSDPDPFGRRFGVCESGGQDLNAEMVRAGLAIPFHEQSDEYDAAMADAITAGVGLWQLGVYFEEPWVFRRRENPGGYR